MFRIWSFASLDWLLLLYIVVRNKKRQKDSNQIHPSKYEEASTETVELVVYRHQE